MHPSSVSYDEPYGREDRGLSNSTRRTVLYVTAYTADTHVKDVLKCLFNILVRFFFARIYQHLLGIVPGPMVVPSLITPAPTQDDVSAYF